jgi:cell wall-associated NlpC family hydrolase
MPRLLRHSGLPLALLLAALLLTACASGPRSREPGPGARITASALAQLGRPYRYGGNTPTGFDCSGLVQYAHGAAGIRVPRTTDDQHDAARPVKLGKLAPGDLLFFRIDSRKVSHVGIYTGDGRFVHAPESGQSVEMRQLDEPYYRERVVGAGRFY